MKLLKLFWVIIKDTKGGTLAITRVTANTLITAAATNSRAAAIEAVVNGDIDATNIEDAAVTAAKLASDAVETAKIKDAAVTNAKLAGSIDLTAKVTGTLPVANGGTEFESGDIIFSTIAKAIAGWTEVSSTYANKFIRVSATALSTGGADTHTHAVGTFAVSGTTSLGTITHTIPAEQTGWVASAASHTHTLSAAVTGTSASGDNVPAYMTLRMWQKS